ncbi:MULTISPECIES: porin [Herbaspirillum]|uniref:Porin transmembrane protein n=1 Tax=Herbaspirillum seropedicae (strain SmR1) TaxID=757424 RepID=D8ISQ9_HERSS|nr:MULTISPECIES: porin [Herbaspirillum]ADJ65475.1 porin transmembrane protein [Herbaspirillum seropedicae SmR1]AKN67308.1 membrane protein [Herbaspirillum seropedicae]AON56387.1 porin transmembrane protein [Herbaspirillum seropedicae]NQE31900.1 membrane protein [Herbaspirillum seropedicae]UMU23315.1 porin [Herbaspirillum seropedicae]
MTRKISLHAVALAAALCASSAMAQSSVTIYGIIDTGVVYTTNANANGNSVFKMPSLTGSFPSRIGFKGTEDLGGGLQAMFVLESGFAPDTGAMGQGGRLFGRQSYVGLKNSWGQLMLGRQVNMTYLSQLKTDVMGPNLFAIGSIDAYLPNARSDNAIGYLGNFSGFTVGATYSFGRDAAGPAGPAATNCPGEVAGNSKACRQVTALLGYDGKGWGVTSSYDILYGNTGASNGMTSSDNTDQRVTLNGYFMLGDVKIGGGVVDRRTRAAANTNTDSDLYYLGVSYPLSVALVLDAQVSRLDVKNSPNDVTLSVARLTYNLSKRTAVYGSLGYIKNGGTSSVALDAGGTVGAGKNQLGVMTGIRHTF